MRFASAGCDIGGHFFCLFLEDGSEVCVSLSARITVEMDQSSCISMSVFFFFFFFSFYFMSDQETKKISHRFVQIFFMERKIPWIEQGG
jgi:hypothetical protein